MQWYYIENGKQAGPISESNLDEMARQNRIRPDTLVWHEGMADWQPYGALKPDQGHPVDAKAATEESVCSECGKVFPQSEMIRHENTWVCSVCKPIFVQRLKEGGPLPGTFVYGGFWIRFGAKIIDWIVIWIVNFLIALPMRKLFIQGNTGQNLGLTAVASLLQMAVYAIYTTFFIGKYAATPGKMACGLKVITAEGYRVSYGRACGRYFAEILSSLILCIGYLMAASDEEKRALHDRICNTRVIKK